MSDITPSKKFLHDLKKLYTEREEKLITDEEFSLFIDEMREREAKSQESMGQVLLKKYLVDIEKEIESEVKEESQQKKRTLDFEEQEKKTQNAIQAQRRAQEQQMEARKQRQVEIKKENERSNFRSEIKRYIYRLENDVQKWQIRYSWFQIILLVFSAITATMAGIEGIPRWVVATTGVIATIIGGLLTTFKIQDRIYASRKALAEIKLSTIN